MKDFILILVFVCLSALQWQYHEFKKEELTWKYDQRFEKIEQKIEEGGKVMVLSLPSAPSPLSTPFPDFSLPKTEE